MKIQTADELSDIAITSTESFKELVNPEGIPKVAMLSYSTKGSAHSELTEKVIEATKLAHEKSTRFTFRWRITIRCCNNSRGSGKKSTG